MKKTGRDARVLPKTVIYDPELTLSLPRGLSVTSGINAIAHAAEGLYAEDANPLISLFAEEGIRALAAVSPRLRYRASLKPGRQFSRGTQQGRSCKLTSRGRFPSSVQHHKLTHVFVTHRSGAP